MATIQDLMGGKNVGLTVLVLSVHNCKGLEKFNQEKKSEGLMGYRVWKRSSGWQVVEHQDDTYDRIKCEKIYYCPFCGENLEVH